MIITVHTDGGSRGNPGHAAVGIVIEMDGQPLFESGEYIGIQTNNVAEYTAVLRALTWLKNYHFPTPPTAIEFVLDSELVTRQLNGEYRVKNAQLLSLWQTAKQTITVLPYPVHFSHVLRHKNTRADALVNQALDMQA